jgi:hypothetical protein
MTSLAEDRKPGDGLPFESGSGSDLHAGKRLGGLRRRDAFVQRGRFTGLQVKVEKAAAATFGRFPHREEALRDWAALQSVDPGRDGCPRCCSSGGMKRCCIGRWATLRAHAPTIGCPRVAVERSAPEFQAWWGQSVRR